LTVIAKKIHAPIRAFIRHDTQLSSILCPVTPGINRRTLISPSAFIRVHLRLDFIFLPKMRQ
jgi:hypothetical protein